ncbi:dihydroneopterin aldolase [Sphingomonas sp. PB4P5]|uniref:dihydroneopterin aldolase n=1 Tax=Parasphingomonas puruogangriensis TaxID=3096155 RepID=UPI002FC70DEC
MTTPTTILVAVRDLAIDALIGVEPHEYGRRQPLIVCVEARLDASRADRLEDTVDYRRIASAAQRLADSHIDLIEDYARQLGLACLTLGAVASVSVEVVKPQALAAGTAVTTVVVQRQPSAQILPFRTVLATDSLGTFRFAFQPGINPAAQRVLAGMVDQFVQTLRGVEASSVALDSGSGEWTAELTLDRRTAPRFDKISMMQGETG